MVEQNTNINEPIVDPTREFEVKESIKIDDGLHYGVISRLEYRNAPYQYTDIFVKLDNADFELKIGYPQVVSENSGFGKLLIKFGAILKKGEKINPHNILMGKRVQFLTNTESVKMDDGRMVELARIVRDSLKVVK